MFKLLMKQLIIVALIILAILSIVLGSVLPWMKARLYIDTLTDMRAGKIQTLDDFKTRFNRPLDFYSPIGGEEVVKFLGEQIAHLIMNNLPKEGGDSTLVPAMREIAVYLETSFSKKNIILESLYGAETYALIWQASVSEDDFKKSENYYKKAYEIGPKLPPVLYGLFDLYNLKGDKENMKKIGEEILKYWPEDENIKKIIQT